MLGVVRPQNYAGQYSSKEVDELSLLELEWGILSPKPRLETLNPELRF